MTQTDHKKSKSEIRNPKCYFVTSLFRYFVTRKGFTLAEMLIVTLIIGVLMGIGGRVYFDQRDKFVYNNTLTKVMGIINTARSMATASSGVSVSGKNVVPPSGYGVYIDMAPAAGQPNFTLFASLGDEDGNPDTFNTKFDKGVLAPPDTIADQTLETFSLPAQLHLQFLKIDNGDGSGLQDSPITWELTGTTPELIITKALILFRPPLAETYLSAGSAPDLIGNLDELGMRFYNPNEITTSAKRCQYVSVNRIRTFPALSYDDCASSNYPLP